MPTAFHRWLRQVLFGALSAWALPASGADSRELPPSTLDFTQLIPKRVPKSIIFAMEGWNLWDPSLIKGDDGLFYLFFSRWPQSLGFDAWATHAEIAYATATSPDGPFEFKATVLPARGERFWDGRSVFNSCVIRRGERYYLYYVGTHGEGAWSATQPIRGAEWWTYRRSQRIGVAVADRLEGPWKRFDKPVLDIGAAGNGLVSNPNLLQRPDGGLMLFYKTLAPGQGNHGGGIVHQSVSGTDPLGPFSRRTPPMVDKRRMLKIDKPIHCVFPIDDHFEWYQGDRYYAIVKDHDAPFLTKSGRCLILLESANGIDWQLSAHPVVKNFMLTWTDGKLQQFDRLEMPKLYLEAGAPRNLCLAARPLRAPRSYVVIIPLGQQPPAP